MTPEEYAQLPETLTVRELRVWVARPGYRTRVLIVATTLLDAEAFPKRDVALLYRVRWFAEIDQASCRSSGSLYLGVVAA